MTSEMAFAAVFTTAKRALSFQQKRAFIQEILFSFFKWGTSTQKKSFLKKWGGGAHAPIAPPPGSAAPVSVYFQPRRPLAIEDTRFQYTF
jgi:hypothetical protein